MLESDEPFVALCAARLLSRRRCWDLTSFTCDRRRHREPLANALTTYDINGLKSDADRRERQRRTWGDQTRPRLRRRRGRCGESLEPQGDSRKRHMPPPA